MKPMCNLCFLFVFGGLAKNTISCPYGSDANSFSDLENRVYHACCRCFLANSELEVCYILRAKFLNIFSYQPFFALRTRKFCVSLWSAIGGHSRIFAPTPTKWIMGFAPSRSRSPCQSVRKATCEHAGLLRDAQKGTCIRNFNGLGVFKDKSLGCF